MSSRERFESLPARALANAERLGPRVCHYYWALDRWVPVGWSAVARVVRDLASGLMDLGHQQGDPVAIVSQTRREWIYADLAVQCAGGITVGVYPTLTPDQSAYVIGHAEARFAVVEDAAQLEKVLTVAGDLPRLERIVVIDAQGIDLDAHAGRVLSYEELRRRGRGAGYDVEARVAAIHAEDAACFIYTSGTTGPPKGAMITHGNVAGALRAFEAIELGEEDLGLSFLPLAHALQRAVDYSALWRGFPVGAYGRGIQRVADDIDELSPTVMAAVPRIFEKIYNGVHEQAAKGSAASQRVFHWAIQIGRRVSELRQKGQPIPAALAAQHRVADRLVYAKLRARLGGCARLFITGGAPIATEILQFFDAAGIQVLEGWGMTETFSAGTMNLPGERRFGSIGRPLPGVELRLDTDGELLIRGPNVFAGYYKQEEETRESFTEDGFFRTGDIARVDEDGYYYIVDRKKDLIITAGGKNIAPQNIENLLKSEPIISQAVVIGDKQPYLVALISVTDEARGELGDDAIKRRVEQAIEKANAELPSFEQVKKFRILPRDLSQDEGEVTPTLKVKRKVVGERFADLVEEMYSEPRAASA